MQKDDQLGIELGAERRKKMSPSGRMQWTIRERGGASMAQRR